jgi:hypothetical protein
VEVEEIAEKRVMDKAGMKRKERARDEIQTIVPAHNSEGKSLA